MNQPAEALKRIRAICEDAPKLNDARDFNGWTAAVREFNERIDSIYQLCLAADGGDGGVRWLAGKTEAG